MKTIEKMNFDIDDAVHDEVLSKKLGVPVIETKSFHRLNQIIGYAKYTNGQSGNIYFRGQSEILKTVFRAYLDKHTKMEPYIKEAGN